ncbi:CHK kinase-like domain-containing protein [Caenorhabditis elegans]|uniref:CHK kinase-like domain-containing protein n=1 Tax=Caenorhabditis elegans TaxID=6239 RepID=Q9XWR4_CAEEL|nr:CHK kinase-like domain-containing protein [Caenorhabditis elegans]CAA21584.2 CHK kinase-like domain-containing protein [Caenorhabditis elegans]|eukprot:NP_501614.2 Uncharacterized protein CELE_Y11D7A.8 [Caenorhabditis elegans]
MGCGSSSPAEVAPAEIIEPSPSSDVPSDPKIPTSYRPSIISLQIPNEFGDDVSSDALSDRSDAQEENVDYLYATDVTLQWLLERIYDKFKKPIPEDPQWIIERLNRPSWDLDYATSSVVRVTFGWDDDELPRSVVLKTPVAKDQRDDEEGKYHYIMFKRECNVYEWTQKFPKLIAPKIIHIKKHSKEGSGVVVMEDVSEKGQEQDPVKGLMLEVVRDLLKQIAYLHSISLKHTSWSTLVADLPPSYYAHTIGSFDDTLTFFERQDVDHSRFVHIGKYFSDEYLHSTATETTELLDIPKVLVHGEPYASNVFTKMEGKEQRILSLIDWTEGHSGCFAEDVAKIICWNLNAKERVDNTSSLLEGYHFHLARYYDGDCPFTVDIIQRAYEVFVPFAMVSLCGKVMSVKNKTEKEPLIERAKSLIQQVYAMERLNES